MSKALSALTYILIALAIIALSVANAEIVASNYLGQELGLAQYNAVITSETSAITLEEGQPGDIMVNVRNEGNMTWLSETDSPIFLSYHFYDSGSGNHLYEGERTALPKALRPGEDVDLLLSFNPPAAAGVYLLEIDMVHEGVTWFKNAGSNPLTVTVTIAD